MLKWINSFPLILLIIAAVLLGLAPFRSEPHLWQKLKMLFDGSLSRPIDIFDLFLHGTPSILLLIKLTQILIQRIKPGENP
jgi:hypothetical protein